MAPEQQLGRAATAASDQFAFGVALWEALAGRRPFDAPSGRERLVAIAAGPPRPTPGPRWLASALRRMLAADPGARYSSMRTAGRGLRRRRARWPVAVATVSAALIAAVALLRTPAQADTCAAADQAIAESWTPAHRSEVAAMLAKSPRPDVTSAGPRIVAGVDEFTSDWRAARVAACRVLAQPNADRARAEGQIGCLERRAGELNAQIDGWRSGRALSSADRAVATLPRVSACDHAPAIHDDIFTALRRAALERAFTQARAAFVAAKVGVAEQQFEAIVAAADSPELVGVRARARIEQARSLVELGRGAEARPVLLAAASDAELAGDDRTRAVAWLQLVEVIGDTEMKPTDAVLIIPLAQAAVSRANDAKFTAGLEAALGKVALNSGDTDQAVAHFTKSLSVPLDPYDEAAQRNAFSLVYQARGDMAAMLEQLELARHALEKRVGSDHPLIAIILSNEAEPLQRLNRGDEAVTNVKRAQSVIEATYGASGDRAASGLSSLAALYAMQGKAADALPIEERALEMMSQLHGPDAANLLTEELNLGGILHDLDRDHDALPHDQNALRIAHLNFDADNLLVAEAEYKTADQLRTLARFDEAMPLAEHALAVRTANTSLAANQRAEVMFLVAELLRDRTRELARAHQLATEALALVQGNHDHFATTIETWLRSR